MNEESLIPGFDTNPLDTGSNATVQPLQNAFSAARPPTSIMFSRGNLVSSRLGSDKAVLARPSTAVRAVGYAASSGSASQRFDQAFLERAKQHNLSSANAAVDVSKEVDPQIQYKNLEAKIINLLETSIILAAKTSELGSEGTAFSTAANEVKGLLVEALNKAKEAYSLDQTLHRFREQHGEHIFHNFELTYAMLFRHTPKSRNEEENEELKRDLSAKKVLPALEKIKNISLIYFKTVITQIHDF